MYVMSKYMIYWSHQLQSIGHLCIGVETPSRPPTPKVSAFPHLCRLLVRSSGAGDTCQTGLYVSSPAAFLRAMNSRFTRSMCVGKSSAGPLTPGTKRTSPVRSFPSAVISTTRPDQASETPKKRTMVFDMSTIS